MTILKSPYPYELPTTTFHERILEQCRKHQEEDPEKRALVNAADESDCVTFYEVIRYSQSFGQWLVNNGLKKGDILLVHLPNCWEFLVAVLGAWSAGAVVSPSSTQFTHFELRYQLEDSTASFLLTHETLYPITKKATTGLKLKRTIVLSSKPIAGTADLGTIFRSKQKRAKFPKFSMNEDLIVLPYSSGTTGTPKGVMISHLNYSAMLESYARKYNDDFKAMGMDGFVAPPTSIIFVPLFHAMGLFGCMNSIFNGTTQLVMKKFSTRTMLKLIEKYSIGTLTMVPAVCGILADSPLLDEYDLSSIAVIACGSAPLSKSVIERLQKRLPGVIVAQGYGMTETSVASHLAKLGAPSNSVGHLVPGTEMKVVDARGRACGPKEEGEIWIRGPQIMKGYWRKEEQTRENFDKDGFMRTGDIGYYEEDGNTYITDRAKELIKVKGKQVPPAELESVILELAEVSDCCVVGVPDEISGELPRAYIVSKGISPDTIHKHVNERVAAYKRLLGGIEFIATIPRTATGKMLRRQLKQEFLNKKGKQAKL